MSINSKESIHPAINVCAIETFGFNCDEIKISSYSLYNRTDTHFECELFLQFFTDNKIVYECVWLLAAPLSIEKLEDPKPVLYTLLEFFLLRKKIQPEMIKQNKIYQEFPKEFKSIVDRFTKREIIVKSSEKTQLLSPIDASEYWWDEEIETGAFYNFDVSVIMPFYKRLEDFKKALPLNAKYFERNGIEVIIVLDCDSEETELLKYIKTYPFINWKVVSNPNEHEWRNPAKVINVGIKHASKKFIMVCSPESVFHTDAIFLLRRALQQSKVEAFALGAVCFTTYEEIDDFLEECAEWRPYGSIMVKKEWAVDVEGYMEVLNKWGFDDDNFRLRLELRGLSRLMISEAQLLHMETKKSMDARLARRKGWKQMVEEAPDEVKNPTETKVNNGNWGNDFDDVVYNWRHNRYRLEMLKTYIKSLNNVDDFYINDKLLMKKHSRVALVQSYNEAEWIDDFLKNTGSYSDGIVLIDDGSSDATYKKAKHPKLLFKIKLKREKGGFNDLRIRNAVLRFANFIDTEWFFWIDVDEKISDKYNDFNFLDTTEKDVVSYKMVHTWESENKKYNSDYPSSFDGVQEKRGIGRNIGACQHTTKKRFHMGRIPYYYAFSNTGVHESNILFLHMGFNSKERREANYKQYMELDTNKNQKSYEHLINHEPELLNVDELELE